MKHATVRYTLDLFSSPDCPPNPGDILLRKSASGQTRGYYRLESVRKIQVKVSRGETARYALGMTPLPDEPAPGARLLVVVDHPRRKKSIANNRFSPLLD